MFADDITICSSKGTLEEASLGALHTFFLAKDWLADNWLVLNEGKYQVRPNNMYLGVNMDKTSEIGVSVEKNFHAHF